MSKFTAIYRGLYTHSLKFSIEKIIEKYDCDIIYSTWETERGREKLLPPSVKTLFAPDPGSGPIQNLNRQTTLSTNGLRECSTDIVFLCRTDVEHNVIPHEKYVDDKIFFSSIMTVIYGHPCPSYDTFFEKGENMEYYCRFGVWLDLVHRDILIKLYENFTNDDLILLKEKFNDCTEQYLFYRYMSSQEGSTDYHKYIHDSVGILDISEIGGKITKKEYLSKTDTEYHNAEKHNLLIKEIGEKRR